MTRSTKKLSAPPIPSDPLCFSPAVACPGRPDKVSKEKGNIISPEKKKKKHLCNFQSNNPCSKFPVWNGPNRLLASLRNFERLLFIQSFPRPRHRSASCGLPLEGKDQSWRPWKSVEMLKIPIIAPVPLLTMLYLHLVYLYTCVYVCIYIYTYLYRYIHIHHILCLSICVYVYVCVCAWWDGSIQI